MRKTRLVILPTKCLHQMGFLLLFLSCPVIGDWGRIRPESESSHKAIQIDREGTCALQRDPPGKLLNFLYENGSDQCRPSEELDSDELTVKPIFRQVRRSDETRVDSKRLTRERNVRESERRESNGERKDVLKAMRRIAEERRNVRRETRKGILRDVREISQMRSRSAELQQHSKVRRQENDRSDRQISVSERRFSRMNSRNDRERLLQNRRMTDRQNERRTEQQRRSIREITNERRENERTVRTLQERREQSRRFVRSVERERQGIRRDNNERSVREGSLKARDGDVTVRQFRERDQERQNERLSLARRNQNNNNNNNSRRSESGRNIENSERRFSQIRKTRMMETAGKVIEERLTRNLDNRRDIDRRKTSGGDVRERRDAPLNVRLDRVLELKSMRARGVTKQEHLIHDVRLENKKTDEKISGGITKWVDLKRYESVKAGDWTMNCVIGAVVYFFSTRHIKAV